MSNNDKTSELYKSKLEMMKPSHIYEKYIMIKVDYWH